MRHKCLSAIFLCAAIAGASFAASMGTVGGDVVDSRGKPVADARVMLQASGGGHLQTSQTNAQGRFWFASLPEGQYSVRASDMGRISEWRQNVWVAPGRETDVTLHLKPAKPGLSATRP
jgi:protocatechuate 3,4-dioxygenase beta subunit